jgi:serine phosphatase RsbU (regulator of sigma subunit)
MYSDGMTEVWDAKDEMLGVEGLSEIARKTARLPLAAMREAIVQGVTSFSVGPVHDDMSLVLVEVN